MADLGIAPAGGEMHEPDRLLRGASAGTRDAGHGNCDRGARMGERASRHGAGDVFAHRAMPLDQPDWNAEHFALARIRIGHEPAIEHIRGARDWR